jgi:ferric-chelate reductase
MFPAFFITVCVHTPYAAPWIYVPIALYGLDLALRLIRLRIKDAVLVPVGLRGQMTLVHVADVQAGWKAGQHVRLRVFSGGLVFQSHPLSILSAPSDSSVYPQGVLNPGTLILAARACGDWTRALSTLANPTSSSPFSAEEDVDSDCNESSLFIPGGGRHVQVMLDGPYGGCSLDLGAHEHVLLVAGGSGLTFVLGVLDDLVGRIVRKGRAGGERTKRIHVKWCIRSFGE